MPLLFAPLMAFGIYRRMRSHFGRQPLKARRKITFLAIFSVAMLFLLIPVHHHPAALLAFGGGAVAGVLLGLLGLHLTVFERTVEGDFYTPHSFIGVGVSLLLVGRMGYRMLMISSNASHPGTATIGLTPLTMLTVGITAGYYVIYYLGLLLHFRKSAGFAVTANSPA
jgi:hypothetical protein